MALNRSWRMSFKVYLFYTVLNIIYQICVQDLGAKIIFARRAKMGEFCGQTQKFVKTQISFCVFAIYLAPLRMTKVDFAQNASTTLCLCAPLRMLLVLHALDELYPWLVGCHCNVFVNAQSSY